MANQVEILSLNIDTQVLLSKLSETKKTIEQLQASQKELQKAGEGSSTQFIQQAAQIKALQQQYNSQLNVVTQLTAADKESSSATQAVTTALNANITSIAEATENNKQLLTVRNQLNLSTEEGQKALEEINAKLNENTEFIRSNVSAAEEQKMNIGNYSDSIKEAATNLNPFNGGLMDFVKRSNEAGGAAPALTGAFGALRAGLTGAMQAGLAFLATPIGAAIGILAVAIGAVVGAFKFMAASMNSTEEGSQKLAKVTGAITGVFNGLWKIVKPLGEFIGTAFIKYFELASAAVEKAVGIISSGLRLLGFESAADGVDKFTTEIKASSKAAADLAVAEIELDKAQRKSKITQLEYQKQAEKLRQQRDDESKSISERIALNNQLGEVLKKQLTDELAIAEKALAVANLRIKSEGKTKETLDAQAEALTEIADIQERVTGQESEQLANLNGLRKEAADAEKERQEKATAARQKAVDDAIQKNKDEIALFEAQQGYKKKSLSDELAYEEELSKKRLALLEKEYKAGKLSKEAYEAEKLNIGNEFLKKQADVTVAQAQRELDLYRKSIEKKKQDDTFFTEEKLKAKQLENDLLFQKEREFQTIRLGQGQINEQEYNDAINIINEENRIKNEEAQALRDEAKKEQEAIDLENQRILDEEKFTNEFDLQLERENLRYQAEIKAAEKTGAATDKIEAIHALNKEKINKAKEMANLQLTSDALGQAASLFKENTMAYKALAISQAVMNTYMGATKALADYSYPLGPIFAGLTIAQGLVSVSKIAGVKLADGGIVPKLSSGKINNGANLSTPLSNGDDTLAYVTQGEVVLNQDQQRRAGGSAFFRSLGVPGFASGGIVGGTTNLGSFNGYKIDYDVLAEKIGESVGRANQSLPSPTVYVDDISSSQANQVRIESGASF